MLGNELGEDKGKIIGQRVLVASGPKIEVSFSAVGTYVGIDSTIPISADTFYGGRNGGGFELLDELK